MELKVVLAGTAVTLAGCGVAIAAVGLVGAVPAVLFSGLAGGVVTGWLSSTEVGTAIDVQQGGFYGLHASGLAGIVLLVALQVLDAPAEVQGGSAVLLLVASPMVVVVFALEGLVGGYVGSGLQIAYADRRDARA